MKDVYKENSLPEFLPGPFSSQDAVTQLHADSAVVNWKGLEEVDLLLISGGGGWW